MPLLLKPDGRTFFFFQKENQNDVALPSVCLPELILSSLAFKSSEVLKYMSDLDTFGGNDPSGMFQMFLKEIFSLITPKVSVIFRSLIRQRWFPVCWFVGL